MRPIVFVRGLWSNLGRRRDALAVASREIRYAVRTLRRAPGFLAVAVGTLALGIGGLKQVPNIP